MPRRVLTLAMALVLGAALSGCKIVATAKKTNTSGTEITFDKRRVDADALVTELWDTKIIPYLDKRAGSFADVRALAASNLDEAGKKYGYREKEEGSPWTMIAKAEGKIIAANTQSKAATFSLDTDGDGKPDLTVQIGPVFKGTALRDSLDFISFNQFTNQIEFAQLAKSLNTHVYNTVLARIPRDALIGKAATVLGTFPLDKADAPTLMTPATLQLGS